MKSVRSVVVFGVAVAILLVSGVAIAASPWIGITLGPGSFGGARVKTVMPGSPGERAGLHAGDEVLTIDDRPTQTPEQVIASVLRAGVGHQAQLRLVDPKGHTRTVAVTYELKPDRETIQRNSLLNRAAPDFKPSIQSGDKLGALSSLRGNVVVLDFFATWCGPCIAALPHMEDMHQSLRAKGVIVLGVSNESPAIVAHAAERFHLTYPLASDDEEKVSASYQVFALPTMVVIDRKGVVRSVAVADMDAVDEAVAAALKAGK
jgi:peroxiredoxin